MKEILTIRQVTRLCAVAPSTVQYWERKGYLKSFKTYGGHRRFEKSHVLEFLEKRGRRLSCEHARNIIEAKSRANRRCEDRVPVSFEVQAQFVNGIVVDSLIKGKILDLSSKGFGVVLTSPGLDKSPIRNLLAKYRNIKAWIKDQVGYLKNPLEGTIRNYHLMQDSIRIGVSFARA